MRLSPRFRKDAGTFYFFDHIAESDKHIAKTVYSQKVDTLIYPGVMCFVGRWLNVVFFSVGDILQVLIQHPDYQAARNYWKVMKNRLKKEGSKSVTKCNRLKLPIDDGKSYLKHIAIPETLLRLIQSVPESSASALGLRFISPVRLPPADLFRFRQT